MNAAAVIVLGLALAGGAAALLMRDTRPEPRWQPGSIFWADDPDTGYTRYEIQEVTWRQRQMFDVDRTTYPAQWWYMTASGWYPEQFLMQNAR